MTIKEKIVTALKREIKEMKKVVLDEFGEAHDELQVGELQGLMYALDIVKNIK